MMKTDKLLLLFTIICSAFVFGIAFRECGAGHPTCDVVPRKQADSLQNIVNIQQGKADSLLAIIEDMMIDLEVKLIEVVKIRNRYIHDTTILKHYDTACPELVAENTLLWEIVKDDSIIIASCGNVVKHQDSSLMMQQAIISGQRANIAELKKQLTTTQKKALHNARLIKLVGLIGLVGWVL